MVSGSWPGAIYLFAGDGKGGYAKAETIQRRDGKPLKAGKASAVAVADWDRDGDLDLLVGNIEGQVHLVSNDGSTEKPAFGAPVRLEAGGEAIAASGGDAGPFAADWDGDGAVDLLLGAGDGSVRFYRNMATSGLAKLAAPVVLVPGASDDEGAPADSPTKDRGGRAKVCAADWNGDGRADLLVGDFKSARGKEPDLTSEQKAERDRLEKEQEQVGARFSKVYEALEASVRRDLGLAEKGELSEEEQERFDERFPAAREKDDDYQEASKASAAVWEKLRPLTPAFEPHGRVWVFLRKAEKSGPRAAANERIR